MSPPSLVFQWIAALVVGGLVAMHGAAGDHGGTGMAIPSTVAAPSMTSTAGGGELSSASTRPSPGIAAVGMGVHAMTVCVALPVTFVLAVLAGSYLGRRRHAVSTRRCWRAVRDARAPPCPPPHVRGVCLT